VTSASHEVVDFSPAHAWLCQAVGTAEGRRRASELARKDDEWSLRGRVRPPARTRTDLLGGRRRRIWRQSSWITVVLGCSVSTRASSMLQASASARCSGVRQLLAVYSGFHTDFKTHNVVNVGVWHNSSKICITQFSKKNLMSVGRPLRILIKNILIKGTNRIA
jgi:hypothetical protein